MLKHILASCSLVAVLGMGTLPVLANPSTPLMAQAAPKSVGDDELQKFVNVARKLKNLSEERSTSIAQAVEQEGLSLDRFREIYAANRDPKVQPKTGVSTDEQAKYDRVLKQLVEIQKQARSKMGEAIQAEGLQVPRFLEILEIVQKTPDLRNKVDQMLK